MRSKILALFFLVCGSLYGEIQCELLITGCGRSGTFYITEVLRNCGLDLRLETLGEYGSASWLMAFDAESVPHDRDSRVGVHFSHVFHQVRHPLKVIASFRANTFPRAWPYIHACIPEIHDEDPFLVKCAKYWYYWNLKVDQEAEWTYRIEDIEDVWDEFQERLNVKLDPNVFKNIPKNRNHISETENITWEDLRLALDDTLFQNIRDLAQHYGYLE